MGDRRQFPTITCFRIDARRQVKMQHGMQALHVERELVRLVHAVHAGKLRRGRHALPHRRLRHQVAAHSARARSGTLSVNTKNGDVNYNTIDSVPDPAHRILSCRDPRAWTMPSGRPHDGCVRWSLF